VASNPPSNGQGRAQGDRARCLADGRRPSAQGVPSEALRDGLCQICHIEDGGLGECRLRFLLRIRKRS